MQRAYSSAVERPDGHREGRSSIIFLIKMNYVYILKSKKNNKYYIGSTNNPSRRLLEHNEGKTKSLKYIRPLKLVFKKEFNNLFDARKMEINLKRLKSRKIIEKIIMDKDIKMGL